MKKILCLCAIFLIASSVMAQKTFKNLEYAIPACLTYDNKPYVVDRDRELRTYQIFDYSLNCAATLEFDDNVRLLSLDIEDLFDEKGFRLSVGGDDLYFTQTLFNDDAEWEYIEGVYKGEKTEWGTSETLSSYLIKKQTGETIAEIDATKYRLSDIVFVGDNCYICVGEEFTNEYGYSSPSVYKYYSVTEFRKFIKGLSTGTRAIPAMVKTAEGGVYDLSGRKISADSKGIHIMEGKKVIR